MNKNALIKKTEAFAQKALAGEGTGHDWWHIERVLNNAKLIAKSEKADWFVVALAVLLHDVGDRKVINKEEDDYTIAETFLRRHKIDEAVITHVMFIIENMSFSKSVGKKKTHNLSPEFLIVQDADRLDAMGAIGIARAFAYGGSKSRPLYDPTYKAQKFTSTKSYRSAKSSSFHHFEEKLFKLKDLMNTKTAKKIAARRHVFMEKYAAQFLDEWHGKK